ncbi:MAG: hypothetical protein HY833_03455 [Candidatus Aenigmarchaeota archaeon]|nr:hypothetical protein [Candidatus Aenigmarchaeota archaeon]
MSSRTAPSLVSLTAFSSVFALSFLVAFSLVVPEADAVRATGGTITYYGDRTIHTFTSNGTFTVTSGGNVDYLVVAGGGGGGGATTSRSGGGGGAGGYRNGTNFAVTSQSYTITVGSGGSGGVFGDYGAYGTDSTFSTITSAGGGRGGYGEGGGPPALGGGSGGSGGGSGGGNTCSGGAGSASPAGQGNNGGNCNGNAGGSGGGAGSIGLDGTGSLIAGGVGLSSSISGSSVNRSTGGEAKSSSCGNCAGVTASANTGDGGGSASGTSTGGNGGSGIVIISYVTEATVCVNETSICHPTIQAAINNATSGQTVVMVEKKASGISMSNIKAYYMFDNSDGNLTNMAGSLNAGSSIGSDGNMSVRPNVTRAAGKLGGAFWYVASGAPYGYSEAHSGSNTTKWEFLHYQGGSSMTTSMNLWIKLTEYPTSSRAAIFSDARTVFSESGFELLLRSTRTLGVNIRGTQDILGLQTPVDALPADGNFHMVTLVIDSTDSNSSNRARIYVDNQLKAASSVNPVYGISGAPTRYPTIASSAESTYTNSTIDEFSIWDRALTDNERSILWNGGIGQSLIEYAQYNENVTVNVTGLTLTSNASTRPMIWSNSSHPLYITANNVTVKDMVILYNGSTSSLFSVYVTSVNATVYNNVINNTGSGNYGHGVHYYTGSVSGRIENNTINIAGGDNNIAIRLHGGDDNNTIQQNIISVGVNSGGGNLGIYVQSSSGNNFTQNTISTNGASSGNNGIYLFSSSNSNVFSLNNISTNGTNTNEAILISSSGSNNFTYNNITASGNYNDKGVYVTGSSGSTKNMIGYNEIRTSGYQNSANACIHLESSANSTIVIGNLLVSCQGSPGNSGIYIETSWNSVLNNTVGITGWQYGIYVSGSNNALVGNNMTVTENVGGTDLVVGEYFSGSNNVVYRDIINMVKATNTGVTNSGMIIYDSNNNTFYDINITNLPGKSSLALGGVSSSKYGYLVNATFNRSAITFPYNGASTSTKLFVQHRMNAVVRDQSNNAVNGALIYGNDTASVANTDNPSSNFSATTNSTGQIPTQLLSEFMANGTYNQTSGYLYFSNYVISASKSGYFPYSTSLNVTSYQNLSAQLEQVLSTIEITARSLYSLTGLQMTSGIATATILETGDSGSATISGAQWSIPIYSRTDLNNTGFTLGIFVNDTNGKSGYFVSRIFGSSSLPPQTTCAAQKWRLTGTVTDPASGSFSSSGTVRVEVEGTQNTNSTAFSNGFWDISLEPCLVSGKVYTFNVLLSDAAGRNGLIVLRQVAK